MRLKLISCEVFTRELCATAARSPHQVDIAFLPKGLHDIGCAGMLARLQAAVDAVDPAQYDAVLLGYGLCNNGIAGLAARTLPIVIPRAHDCMTLFFGSRERYEDHFRKNPGTYFLTTGWIERGEATGDLRQLSIQHANGMDMTYNELVAKYGEDNARYLYDQLCDQTKHYTKLTFIEMGLEPDGSFLETARKRAEEKGLAFSTEVGNLRLIHALVNGPWDEKEFLTVEPGFRIATDFSDGLIIAEKAPS
ncbi:MAG TPA: DUF1638 domain-containing protein [Bacteroidota bacterium]|nr:DUF1638 domain-containing protein [Bacteroidota bacterium]